MSFLSRARTFVSMPRLLVFVFIWAIPLLSSAQSIPNWELTRLNVADGLSDNNIFHIFKDSRGFLWISTQNGVNRWDGYEFRTYNYNPSDTNSLSGNWVNFTFEDRAGFLWFGTYGAGLCRFDPRSEKFDRYPKLDRPGGLSSDVITCALQDASGMLWLGTANAGLSRFDPSTGMFFAFQKSETLTDEAAKAAIPNTSFSGPPSAHITCLLEADEHRLWVGTAFGLSRFDKRSGRFEYFFNEPNKPRSLPYSFVIGLKRSAQGDVWVQMPNAWARFDTQQNDFQRENLFPGIPMEASISRFTTDGAGSVWEATENGVNHWHPRHNQFELGLGERYPAGVFGLKKIRTLLEHGGFLWIASEEGLIRCPIGGSNVERFLPQNFHALLTDGEVLWAASKTDGLFRVELPVGTVQHFPTAVNGRGPTSNNLIVIAKDAWGKIWLGGHRVFDRFDPQSGIFLKEFL
ncbi:MAG: two-component regulator propeller domain-containing protein [Saprospiraceae bacterium]